MGEAGHRGVEGGELDRHRDPDLGLHLLHHLGGAGLDRGCVLGRVGGELIDVELQGVGARLLHR